jgi:hypothetical protein
MKTLSRDTIRNNPIVVLRHRKTQNSCFVKTALQSYLDHKHVDDSDVLNVAVRLEFLAQLLPARLRVHRQLVAVHHGRDEPPPGLVQGSDPQPRLIVVERQQRFHLLPSFGIRST